MKEGLGGMRRRLASLLLVALTVQLTAVAPVAAHSIRDADTEADGVVLAEAVTLTLEVPAGQLAGPITATATLSSDPGGGSIVWRVGSGSDTATPVGPGGVTELALGSLAAGGHTLYAHFTGYDVYGETTETSTGFAVLYTTTTTISTNRTTAWKGELPVVLTATIANYEWPLGTVTFLDDVAGTVVDLGPATVDMNTLKATYSSSSLRVGTHSIRARYSGTTWTAESTSDPIIVTVNADTAVHASFSSSLSKFYPYKDGVKDTVALGGKLDETASVTIRIYNSDNVRKRTFSLGTKGVGAYSVTWNGRTSAGTRLPSGKYKVKASFKDARGNTRSIYAYVTISWRQAEWKTGSVITKYGDQFAYYADQDTERLYYSPDYSRGRTLDAGAMFRDCDPCAYVYGLKTYQLNTAGIAFRDVWIQVYGHGYTDREHTGMSFVVSPSTGAWARGNSLPEYIEAGTSAGIVVPSPYVNSAKQVKIVISMREQLGDAWDLHWTKLKYQYAVWK